MIQLLDDNELPESGALSKAAHKISALMKKLHYRLFSGMAYAKPEGGIPYFLFGQPSSQFLLILWNTLVLQNFNAGKSFPLQQNLRSNCFVMLINFPPDRFQPSDTQISTSNSMVWNVINYLSLVTNEKKKFSRVQRTSANYVKICIQIFLIFCNYLKQFSN